MARRPALRALACRLGILPGYRPCGGGPSRRTPDATREAIAGALGYEAGDEAAARRSLARLEEERAERPRARPAPARCVTPDEKLGGRPAFGLWSNLYTLRGESSLGVGNLSDLESLADFAASAGAAFVGVNPLHAVRYRGSEVSPYSPISRLFRSRLYIDVQRVPEWKECPEARAQLDAPPAARERARLAASEHIDYEAAAALQTQLLARLHAAFAARHGAADTARGRDYARFRERGGPLLRDFATFLALEEHLAREGHPRDWRAWPAEYRSPGAEAVRSFRERHAGEVDRHRWTQFELDRQLRRVAGRAERAGLGLGVYQDLALGSVPSGFDTWAFPGAFVRGVSLGAPPDAYASEGQDWGLPPLHPERVADDDFAMWRALLRGSFEASGALRIDHVLGLFRQWWVPSGWPASQGAYVRFPVGDLLRVLADESRRAGAIVVGEDLGTVPPQVAPTLARYEVLSSRVMLFERERSGAFHPAKHYPRRALATFDTHDHPTLAAFWSGRDLEIRREVGLLGSDAELEGARAEREREKRALRARLVSGGYLEAGVPEPGHAALCAAVNAFLCSTPCPLVGVSLDDLAGELEPVNVPGVSQAVYPSWTRRMARPLAAIAADPAVARALAGTAARDPRRT